jgi:hypothetical protein
VRRLSLGVIAALSSIALVACSVDAGNPPEAPPQSSIDPTVDRPSAGQVVRACGSHYAADFDAGMESRIVEAGTVSLVGFRVAPEPPEGAPVRTFKMMVRLSANADAKLETMTEGTSLLYDRARFAARNVYQLTDGERSVRFTGCPDQAAVFNGAVLTSGPLTIDLQITVSGQTTPIQVSAYDG